MAISQKELQKHWDSSKALYYKKVGTTFIRLAKKGEVIATVVDGKTETVNKAKAGDFVARGPKGEEYIIDADTFKKRYAGPNPTEEYQEYKPLGTCYAIQWKGKPLKFMASWGEPMLLEKDDYLCTTSLEKLDLYRIEREIFMKTYKKLVKPSKVIQASVHAALTAASTAAAEPVLRKEAKRCGTNVLGFMKAYMYSPGADTYPCVLIMNKRPFFKQLSSLGYRRVFDDYFSNGKFSIEPFETKADVNGVAILRTVFPDEMAEAEAYKKDAAG